MWLNEFAGMTNLVDMTTIWLDANLKYISVTGKLQCTNEVKALPIKLISDVHE